MHKATGLSVTRMYVSECLSCPPQFRRNPLFPMAVLTCCLMPSMASLFTHTACQIFIARALAQRQGAGARHGGWLPPLAAPPAALPCVPSCLSSRHAPIAGTLVFTPFFSLKSNELQEPNEARRLSSSTSTASNGNLVKSGMLKLEKAPLHTGSPVQYRIPVQDSTDSRW